MKLDETHLAAIGHSLAEGLLQRVGKDLPPHILVNLARDPDWLDRAVAEAEAAAFLGVKVSTLQAWRVRGGGPRFVRPSHRLIRYTRRDLLAWQLRNTATNTGQPLAGAGEQV